MIGQAAPWLREIEVFTSEAEGFYRFVIPSLVIAKDGTILAFCEGRKYGPGDYEAGYLLLKRSADNGVTWKQLQQVAGNTDNPFHNPTAVVDQDTGTIWLAFGQEAFQTFVIHSNDSGATWSEPLEITKDVTAPDWVHHVVGPGSGIQTRSGRLILTGDHIDNTRYDSVFSRSHVIYSDDHGANWKLGGRLDRGTNECEVVETSDGSLYMTSRSADRSKHHRISSWSRDGGDTWSEPVYVEELPDPICQASIRRYTDATIHDRDRILFANPASETRDHLTVRISYDECKTWAVSKVLYVGPSAYSDMAIAPDMSICCLYDRGATAAYESIQLAQFNLEWLSDGKDYIGRG